MAPIDQLAQLRQLAGTAEVHAREEHGQTLGPDSAAAVDRILLAEAGRADVPQKGMLSACYGAWLGWLSIQRGDARWIGLDEPAAPRILASGLVFSPMDAVRRRLEDPQSPTLPEVLQRLDAWT